MLTTRKSATTQLSKEDKDARKFIVRNVANDLFSLVKGPRSLSLDNGWYVGSPDKEAKEKPEFIRKYRTWR
jgi:hypothetical protein